jgi:hypothetical protein
MEKLSASRLLKQEALLSEDISTSGGMAAQLHYCPSPSPSNTNNEVNTHHAPNFRNRFRLHTATLPPSSLLSHIT